MGHTYKGQTKQRQGRKSLIAACASRTKILDKNPIKASNRGMKTPTLLIPLILFVLLGACSSDPEDASANSTGKDASGKNTPSDNVSPTVNLHGTGGPLFMPYAEIHELNQTYLNVTWGDPDNWIKGQLPGPVFKLELSNKATFEEILSSREYIGDYNASFSKLTPGVSHFLRLSATPPEGDERWLPSKSHVIAFSTFSNTTGEPSGIIITPHFGSVNIEWPAAKAAGLVEYSVEIFEDIEMQFLAHRIITRKTSLEAIPLPCEKTYWLQFFHGPVQGNEKDLASLPFVTQFEVPGNQLNAPENLSATIINDEVKLSWEPVGNNLEPIEYHLDVFIGDQLTELYGDFRIDEPFRILEDSKTYGTFNFELRAMPKTANVKDVTSDYASLLFEMPTNSFDPPRSPSLSPSPDDNMLLTANWQAPENANENLRYEIEIAEEGNFTFNSRLEQRIEPVDVTFSEFTGRELGKTYFLRIRSLGRERDATQVPSEWTETITFSMPAPPKPIEFNATEEKASLP